MDRFIKVNILGRENVINSLSCESECGHWQMTLDYEGQRVLGRDGGIGKM